MKRRILSVLLTMCLAVGAVSADVFVSSAWSGISSDFKGSDVTDDAGAAGTVDYLMQKYRDGNTWTLGGECWGYAEKINEFLAADNDIEYFKGLKNTQKNFMNKCRGVKAGTHVRFSNNKEFSSWVGHSVVLLKVTDETLYWADNNYDRANTVHYYTGTIDEFWMLYGQYAYLNMVKEPISYKEYTKPKITSKADTTSGGIKLTWLPTSDTEEYRIYRSYAKGGTYKKIASTKELTYFDHTVDLGRTVYYKVKSARSQGITSSGYVTNRLRLSVPSVSLVNNEDRGIVLTWDKVANADRYKVYRKVDGGKETLLKTTTECSYKDGAPVSGSVYFYRVKAVYDKNSGADSKYSASVSGSSAIATPTGLSGTTDENNHLTLRWNAVNGADYYILYCTRQEYGADGAYWVEASGLTGTSYFDTVRLPGQKYYYKISAYDVDTGKESALSSWILI